MALLSATVAFFSYYHYKVQKPAIFNSIHSQSGPRFPIMIDAGSIDFIKLSNGRSIYDITHRFPKAQCCGSGLLHVGRPASASFQLIKKWAHMWTVCAVEAG